MTLSPVLLLALVSPLTQAGDEQAPPPSLAGLWEARRHFKDSAEGDLALTRHGDEWHAELGSHRVRASAVDGAISFMIPGDRGSFQGALGGDGTITGFWTQPETHHGGMRAASPVELRPSGDQAWFGEVAPMDDSFTCFLVVTEGDDGSFRTFLRNPDRNFGVFAGAERMERSGDEVRLIGRWRGRDEETVLSRGTYAAWNDSFSLSIRSATFDFHRVTDDPANAFYARGLNPAPWVYRAPPALDDGWAVGTLEGAGMKEGPLRELVASVVDPPADSVHAPYVHAMLIARHGKLVVEEYFHGFHRAVPHDTRSAAKSLASFLVGAAMEAGEPVTLSSPVYETIGEPYFTESLDPRASRMTLEHLLTMSSGFDCDESDPDSPGNEDNLQSQRENPNWYDLTLRLDTVREPGQKAMYCSINPNLAGNVLGAATGKPLEALLHRYVAEPLDFGSYHLYLQPTGEPYLGGGSFFLARDFMKLGQVLVDGGVWNGRGILSEDFARSSVKAQVDIGGRDYGYLWWVTELPYREGTVQAFFAGGNGGQVVMGVPELELTALFYAGNYSDRVMYRIQEELIPEFVLKAIE